MISTSVDELVENRETKRMNGEKDATVWPELAARLRARLPIATWNSSFATARPLVLDDHRLILAVPHSIAKERIESRYLTLITEVLLEVTGQRMTVSIEVLESEPGSSDVFEVEPVAIDHPRPPSTLPFAASEQVSGDLVLNQRYTFADFVIGSSNRFAHAAAMSVAETPARSYNPLFIYGDSGLGKTHLLQAIAHYVRENYPSSRIRYVSTETFMNEFVDAIKTNTTGGFKRRYRDDCDVLLIDDIQFMEGKEGTQEEFFHTFNFLHQSGRQIVISSDRPPKNIATLEDRLRSRFEWGLITDVQPPEIETRLAILRKKAERERIAVPDDVFTFIGTHIKDNIRELEGALNRVCAYAGLNRVPLDLAMAERVLSDLLSGNEPRPVTAKAILNATAEMFGFSIVDLTGQSRRRPLVTARQVGMYVFRELTDFSYPMIGREFGDRDHTTVIHAVEKITEQMKERRAIYDQVSELIRVIKSGG
jgi:chromosomal replication initiator protein